MGPIKRVHVRHLVKFRGDRSNLYRDLAIFKTVVVRHLVRGSMCVTVPIFMEIAQTDTEI